MKTKTNSFRYLLSQMKGSWRYIFLAVIFIVFGAFFEFLGPKLIGVTVDSVIGTAPFDLPAGITDYIESVGGRAFLVENLGALIGVFAVVAILTALCEMVRLYALCERALIYDWCLSDGSYSLMHYGRTMLPRFLAGFRANR
jgi:ABC-type multidrug transport system fused ATPase/permease subunit